MVNDNCLMKGKLRDNGALSFVMTQNKDNPQERKGLVSSSYKFVNVY